MRTRARNRRRSLVTARSASSERNALAGQRRRGWVYIVVLGALCRCSAHTGSGKDEAERCFLRQQERKKGHLFRKILQIRRKTSALKLVPFRMPVGQLKRIAAVFLFR